MTDKLTEKLIEKAVDGIFSLGSWAKSELFRIRNLDPDLRKLNDTRRRIEALLADAEQRHCIDDDHVRLWLRSLQSLAFDAQDLDEEFTAITDNFAADPNSRKRKRSPSFFVNKQFVDRIEKLRKNYEEINEDRKFLRFRPGEARRRVPSGSENFPLMLQESSLRDEAQVYGREIERDKIVGLLTNDLIPRDLPVFSIIGCGGIGKTTIARIVFEHVSVKEFFDLRIWVGLSQGFDVVKTTRMIIESVDKEECCLSCFNLLQYRLKEIVMKKRFLIVLDNVWNEDLDFWGKLRVPMVDNGVDGSRVLVTTRSERVSMNMQASHTFRLQGLPFEHCWTMFSERAFVRREGSKTLEGNPELKRIGMEIVEKCQGSPILVNSIASILCSELHENDWRCVLDDMSEDGEVSRGIVRTLRVSYDHLPLHLKHCFAFCSIFPVGYEFDKDELIKLWMALGFIKPSGGRRRVEDIGGKYFTDLLWRSFFHSSDSYHNKEKQMYKMPSVIHELARSVSKFECVVKDEVQPDKIKMARYIMLSHGYLEPMVFHFRRYWKTSA